MLRVAICDDDEADLRRIVMFTNRYFTENEICAEIREFSHPDALLACFEKEFYHIFLLDMVMPMLTGLELGREIRRQSIDAQIIFITSEPGLALDAYSVNPLHYLLKPVSKEALFKTLELASLKVNYGDKTVISVKTKDGLRSFSTDVVVFCEYSNHAVSYTLVNGEVVDTMTIAGNFAEHIAPLLRDKRFIHCHAAFAINMSYVERLNKEGFILKNGAFVPVSQKKFSLVRNIYMNYRLGEI